MKETEAYFRCLHGCKKSDFQLMEQERCDWLGVHKLCGKTNYVTETLRSIETFYDPDFSNYERECMRSNRFSTLTDDGNAISYDEMNKDLNLWKKSCKDIQKFETVSNLTVKSHFV